MLLDEAVDISLELMDVVSLMFDLYSVETLGF